MLIRLHEQALVSSTSHDPDSSRARPLGSKISPWQGWVDMKTSPAQSLDRQIQNVNVRCRPKEITFILSGLCQPLKYQGRISFDHGCIEILTVVNMERSGNEGNAFRAPFQLVSSGCREYETPESWGCANRALKQACQNENPTLWLLLFPAMRCSRRIW